jgi:hypothetical protein
MAIERGDKIAYGHERYISIYDCSMKKTISSTALCKGLTFKMIALTEDLMGIANGGYVSFIDRRNNAKTQHFSMGKECRTLTGVNECTVFYGCGDGEVGLVDNRRVEKKLWSTCIGHKSRIYDVCKIG